MEISEGLKNTLSVVGEKASNYVAELVSLGTLPTPAKIITMIIAVGLIVLGLKITHKVGKIVLIGLSILLIISVFISLTS